MKTAKHVLFNLLLIGGVFVLFMALIASFKGCEKIDIEEDRSTYLDPKDSLGRGGDTYYDPKDYILSDSVVNKRR